MENPYIKQFPDLMSGKKIMYVHGFLSSGQSGTVKMLQDLMPNATFVAEDIPVHPEEGMEMLLKLQETEKPDLIIGTSMGGMYTEMLKGTDRILVNPAFEMGNTMSSMTGKQEFQNPRKDGVNELMVTKGLIKDVDNAPIPAPINAPAKILPAPSVAILIAAPMAHTATTPRPIARFLVNPSQSNSPSLGASS